MIRQATRITWIILFQDALFSDFLELKGQPACPYDHHFKANSMVIEVF